MSAAVHVPMRTCVGCRRQDEPGNLVRYVLVSGVVTRDDRARLPGRGAWLHDDETCRQTALKRGGFARSFRSKVSWAGPADGPGA